MPELKERYINLLREYTKNYSEETLYRAGKLSKELVIAKQGPEEIIQLHMEAMEHVVKEFPPLQGPNVVLNSFTLLLETMMSYGLAYREYIDIKNKKVNRLETYAEKLETANRALEQRIKELTVVQELTQALGSSMELTSILKLIVDKLSSVVNYDSCSIYLINRTTGQPIINLIKGEQKEAPPHLLQKAVTGKDSIIVPDNTEECTVTYLLVPMLIENKVTGLIILSGSSKTTFNDDTIKLISIFAGQAAAAIERANLYEKTREMALTDEKTGLYNYRAFNFFLDKELKRAQRYNHFLSLIILDIDDFKILNDTYGHLEGDYVLNELAQIIQNTAREVDISARYGGEEFCVILPETTREQAYTIADRLRKNVENHIFTHSDKKTTSKITVSLGISTYPQDGNIKEDLIKMADLGLYRAKNSGKNRVAFSQ
ncbi:diguanylate cyclase [Desulfolucanica intricata]|uniref:diguanylate cyclase n=1 Tax=Desulfolucanica intricata TaxID=1285191 RepID=UPI00082C334C|nr:diguanylate cyclase [Desulfolucanica intricata]